MLTDWLMADSKTAETQTSTNIHVGEINKLVLLHKQREEASKKSLPRAESVLNQLTSGTEML